MRALINADSRSSGRFWLEGVEVLIGDPAAALAKGIIYLSEDRKSSGLFLTFSIAENIGASTLDRYADRFGVVSLFGPSQAQSGVHPEDGYSAAG